MNHCLPFDQTFANACSEIYDGREFRRLAKGGTKMTMCVDGFARIGWSYYLK